MTPRPGGRRRRPSLEVVELTAEGRCSDALARGERLLAAMADPDEAADRLDVLGAMSDAARLGGDPEQGLALALRGVEEATLAFGPGHEITLCEREGLASLYEQMGRDELARAIREQVRAIRAEEADGLPED